MARTESTLQLQIDLDRFSRLCTYVVDPHTLTELARRLGLSTAGLSRCLDRLDNKYGTLVERGKKRVVLTQKGQQVRDAYRDDILSRVMLFDKQFRVRTRPENMICLGASPFLLAHIMPFGVNDFLDQAKQNTSGGWSTWRKEGICITCEEAYHVDPTLELVATEALDCAIIWNYEGRERKILDTKGLTCLKASQSLDAVVAFGRDHKFMNRVGTEQAYVLMDELTTEQLFVLEEGHQPLARSLKPPNTLAGGKRIEQTSILSMLSAIRTGDPGVCILAGVFPALDRYRRDGSLFFLPLRESKEVQATWDVLYVVKHRKPEKDKWREAPPFTAEMFDFAAGAKEEDGDENPGIDRLELVKYLLVHLEAMMKEPLFTESGWTLPIVGGDDARGRAEAALVEIYNRLPEYTQSYYVTAAKVGFTTPKWVHSEIRWALEEKNGGMSRRPEYEGTEVVPKSSDGRAAGTYKLKARLVGNQLICIRGNRLDAYGARTDSDSFVANLYLLPQEGGPIYGIWSGLDESWNSPVTAPFVLAHADQELSVSELRHASYAIMLRTLTDVRALPPNCEENTLHNNQ